jgi:anti-sigma-K factor RskA
MSHPFSPESAGPTPLQLAAYVDGELGPADRATVEAWLRDHPESRADVEGQRQLLRLWQTGTPADPGEAAWANVLAGAEAAALAGTTAGRAGSRLKSVVRLATALTSVAAVALLALALMHLLTPRPQERVAPLPVASSTDVEILSMEGGDVGALVVGEPPVRGPFTLASADDMTVDDSGRDVVLVNPPQHEKGVKGHLPQPSPSPMIVPVDPSAGKAP